MSNHSIDFGVMPVITLYQPWATWILRGWKEIATRTHDRFRSLEGKRILIHAGKKTDDSDAVIRNPYLTIEQLLYKPDEVINGYIIGSTLVQNFRLLNENDSIRALIDCGSVLRYGLFMNETLTFADPIKEKGEMGIWYYDLDNMRKVKITK